MSPDQRLSYRIARAAWSLGFAHITRAHVKDANKLLDERDRDAVRGRRGARAEGETFRVPVATFGDGG